jgi:hypothetical protein
MSETFAPLVVLSASGFPWRTRSHPKGLELRAKLDFSHGYDPTQENRDSAVVGGVRVGSDAPIVVQSMTNTDTADIPSTVQQCAALARAGSELVRVTVNNEEAAAAVPHIVEQLDRQGIRVPIIGDFHYNGHVLLKKYPECARALAKYRINPGNASIGRTGRFEFPHHDRSRGQEPEAGAHRRELGLARPNAANPHDGREFPLAEPKDAREVTMEAMVVSALELRRIGGKIWPPPRSNHPQRKSQRRAGFDRRLPRSRCPL